MAMLPLPLTKPITLQWQCCFFLQGRKKEEYPKPRTKGREVSYGKIWPTTAAATQGLLSGMPLILKMEFIRLWNSILSEPGQPSAQLSRLIHHTACKKVIRTIRRLYRTVYITWLVASYDTHKGNHWLISDPTNKNAKSTLNVGFI